MFPAIATGGTSPKSSVMREGRLIQATSRFDRLASVGGRAVGQGADGNELKASSKATLIPFKDLQSALGGPGRVGHLPLYLGIDDSVESSDQRFTGHPSQTLHHPEKWRRVHSYTSARNGVSATAVILIQVHRSANT